MGVERMHSPKYWLMRAEEFRTKADNCEYPATRDSLRQVAQNFEELARRAQQILDADERRQLEPRGGGTLTIHAPLWASCVAGRI
ncbi:hypothetical protein BST63_16880 [Bradyrhizobium canariense]|uniref:Uncharacterized protein n=1 Tax=Bradyrhizobium canariense TaxID=255045 RepID=A0ABX3X4K8_9BRAD|nr:hypothetical protein BSR47_18935 [Bradyrhizobium canariense]OSJ28530.1 hypothetical protein BST63_16880 [Bradyrhizobium canariense]